MPCINVREGDGVVSVISLDGCGAPSPGAAGLLAMDNISEVSFEDQVTEGDEVTERNFGGRKCYSDVGCDEISSITVGLTSCGINPALDATLIGSSSKVAQGAVRGYGRKDLSCNQNVAIEVLMRLDTDACEGSGEAPIAGWLFPLVKNWKPNQGTTLNGSDLVKPAYGGKGFKNASIFSTLVGPLAKWADILDASNEWYAFYIFDGAEVQLPTVSCDPLALTTATS